jgi:uncharacterized protein
VSTPPVSNPLDPERDAQSRGAAQAELLALLREDPELLARHPEILADLRIPHPAGGAVSLLEHQVQVLRQRERALRGRMAELVENARDNEELGQRIHRLTLALIDCPGLDEVLATLYQSLREDFRADAAAVRLFAAPAAPGNQGMGELLGPGPEARALYLGVLGARRPVCGRIGGVLARGLFGDQASALGSAALVPLGAGEPFGLLGIGSRDPLRYHPGMGTVFLRQLAEVVSRMLSPHLVP